MPYDLDQFIADCRASLGRDPGPPGREEVRKGLERLLANAEFVRKYCGDDAPNGIKILYEDTKLGFQVLSHCYDSARALSDRAEGGVIDECGHWVFEEKPRFICEQLGQFWAKSFPA